MDALDKLAGRRILFLNWRDLRNPDAGGAEVYAEQIASRFSHAGAHVTLFTSDFATAAPNDWDRDYLVIRDGGRLGVYRAAARHLRKYGDRYDAIVDCQNGIPFFSPLWTPKTAATVGVVHHVHQDQFDMYLPWPANRIGRLLEGPIATKVYGDRPFVAVSPSTRAEMRRRLHVRGPIHVVPNGVSTPPSSTALRSVSPSIGVVTRIVPHKRLHLLVRAVPELLRIWPDLRVTIAGTGPGLAQLEQEVRRLGIESVVDLPGRVTEQEKSDLLRSAWLTVVPSLAEGWGLTVLEANALGTPAVAFDVPGLQDSVRDGRTGWLVPSEDDLTPTLIQALRQLGDPAREAAIRAECLRWARGFTWDATSERLARVLLGEMARKQLNVSWHRRAIDLSTVVTGSAADPEAAGHVLEATLRITDPWSIHEGGFRALLGGCDETEAMRVLHRADLHPVRLRLASRADILYGAEGFE